MIFDDWGHITRPAIRPATPSDASAIARIHVDCWRTSYKGIVPDEVLKQVKYRDRTQTWMRLIAGGDSGPYVYVAEHPGEGIVGFIAAGPERSDTPDYTGEVYALFVAEKHQRRGIGRGLLELVAQVFAENAHRGLLAWNFSDTPANEFFTRLGATTVATRNRTFGDTTVEETAFGWPDINRLLVAAYEQEQEAGQQTAEPEPADDSGNDEESGDTR